MPPFNGSAWPVIRVANSRRGTEHTRIFTKRNYRSWNDHAYRVDNREMDLKDTMAINLRRVRRENKLTQEDLAHIAGLSTRYVGAIERADVSASVTILGRIADALGVEPSELVIRQ